MNYKDLGHPLRESGGEPFAYVTGTIVKRRSSQTDQETHMRLPENGWQVAHTLIDKGELVVWCDRARFRFRAIGEDPKKKDDIECYKDGRWIILDSKSAQIIRCIEEQVDGNLYKPQPIVHKNKKQTT